MYVRLQMTMIDTVKSYCYVTLVEVKHVIKEDWFLVNEFIGK